MMNAPAVIEQRYFSPRIAHQLAGIVGLPQHVVKLRRPAVPGRCDRVIDIAADEVEFIAALRDIGYVEIERGWKQ